MLVGQPLLGERDEDLARETYLEALAAASPGFAVQPAKMAYELKPEGASKDRALAALTAPDRSGRRLT